MTPLETRGRRVYSRARKLAAPSAASSLTIPPADPAAPVANAAPAEAVPVELKAVEQTLAAAGDARFLDLSGRFTFDERAQLTRGVNGLAEKTHAKVYVLALPGKTDVASFAAIHADLKLQPRDVLFIFSADKRHLHSQAIPKTAGAEILKDTNHDFYKSQTTGVLKMFDAIGVRLSSATTTSTAQPSTTTPRPAPKTKVPTEWVVLAVAVLVIAFAVLRTNKKPVPKNPARKS